MDENALARKMFLAQRLAWPLAAKIRHSETLIREWYEIHDGKAAVSVSGKDSLVLEHLVRSLYPDVPSVYADTGVEFPEVRRFHRERGSVILRPFKPFHQVVVEDGWPVISKEQAQWVRELRVTHSAALRRLRLDGIRPNGEKSKFFLSKKWHRLLSAPFLVSEKCCHSLKTGPLDKWHKEHGYVPFVGSRVAESKNRQTQWVLNGCNMFDLKRPRSVPLAIWTEADVWEYIRLHNIALPEIYAMGYRRTGCVLCGFGAHLEKPPNRFQLLYKTHPKLWEYGMLRLGMAEVLDYCGIPWA